MAQSWEERFGELAAQQFEKERRELLAILNKAKSAAYAQKATVDWQTVDTEWMRFLDGQGDEWREAFLPAIQGVITDQAAHLSVEFGVQFNVLNVFASEMFEEYMIQFAQPIMATTNRDIVFLMKQVMDNGWSIPETSKQLSLTFDKYLDPDFTLDGRKLTDEEMDWFHDRSPRYRRDNIGRTETIGASNFGNHELYRDWDPGIYKEWLATADNRTRDSHLDAWARYREGGNPGPIPLDQPFIVGGVPMMYPGDKSAPPEEICQCRCTEIPFSPAWAGL